MLNFGSYNYLGFSENNGPCSEAASDVTHKYGIMSYGSRQELGKCALLIYKYIPFIGYLVMSTYQDITVGKVYK